jgi:alpha-D-xyloside xylohydrolase
VKFTDGYWQMRAGLTAHFPEQVYEVDVEPDGLTVYAPTRRLTHRGDTLNTPMVSVRVSSPMHNVARIEIQHHKGRRRSKPTFELEPLTAPAITIDDDAQAATLSSGDLTVRVERAGDWRVDFTAGGRLLTTSGRHGVGLIDTEQGPYIHEQLALGVGECVYGLGERFTPFVKNGQVVDLWNEDGGTSSEQAYKNVPFYVTNRGYGVFVNHPERVSFEIGSEKVERVQFSVPGEYLEYFLIYGPPPRDVLSRYTALTGRPALPPAWSFGLWLSTSFTTDYDEDTVTSFIQGMADRAVPLHVFHFDCFWMKAFHWVDLEWDTRAFPDPEGMLRRLHARGLRVCVWINPYIAERSTLFDEGMQRGYLVRRPDGDVWQWDRWQAGMALVDFTNPDACRWFGARLRALLDMGVDCFKTDFGERIPTDVVYFDSASDPVKMHNYYSYLYNKTVFQVLEDCLGEGQAVVFARSATTGGQRFPIHWGGDSTASYESMAETLRGGLSLGLSGFGFWSHDIGGFEETASADVYKRWCAFGLLSSHSRLHGSRSYRVPWLFDEEAVDVLRFFTRLKCRLMPYLFQAAHEAHAMGVPVMRAMVLEFTGDPACDYLDRQYLLGDSLLVAPIFSPDGAVDYYVPPGRWTRFLTGEVVEGGRWLHEVHKYLSLPLLVRPNAIIPIGSVEDRPDYDFDDGVTLHVFELDDGITRSVLVPALRGDAAVWFEVSREGQQVRVESREATRPWEVLLRNIAAVHAVDGGSIRPDPLGTRIIPADGLSRVTVRLQAV